MQRESSSRLFEAVMYCLNKGENRHHIYDVTRSAEDIWLQRRAALENHPETHYSSDRWIPVSEGLPEQKNRCVLVYTDRKNVYAAMLDAVGWCHFGGHGTPLYRTGEAVTHWRPTPSPPEDVTSSTPEPQRDAAPHQHDTLDDALGCYVCQTWLMDRIETRRQSAGKEEAK